MSNRFHRKIAEKRHAPRKVQQLIDLANSVPPELELPEPMGNFQKIMKLVRGVDFKRFRQIRGGVKPDQFLQKLLGAGAPKTFNRVLESYLRLKDARALLETIARIPEIRPGLKARWLLPRLQMMAVRAQTDERGRLDFGLNPILTALTGAEAHRIRRCPICMKFYWAARKDKPACTKGCTHILRTRRWREKYPGRYKIQRVRKGRAPASERLQHSADLEREREELQKLKAPPPAGLRRKPRLPKGPK
jgi:hypothetical protein